MSASAETIVFLHIPKTAGATLQKILERKCGRDRILSFDGHDHRAGIERFKKLPEQERAQYRLIQGHVRFGLHRFVPGKCSYITFLREPIARALSFYHYARTVPDHYLYRRINEDGATLKTLLAQKATPELFNLQTRMIAGDEWDNLRREVDGEALERAQENLRAHFSFVGLTEEFDASISLLGRTFGWSFPFYVKRNVTARKPHTSSVDAETRSLLCDANAFDLKLYEYARNLFEAQRRAGGVAFESELRRFQRLNRVWSFAYESYETIRRGVAHLVGRRIAKGPPVETLRHIESDSSI